MGNSMSLSFDGLDELLKRFEGQLDMLQPAAGKALEAAHGVVTPKLASAIASHRRTGRTAASLWGYPLIEWQGSTLASVRVGFSISGGGLASVFLMYGTPRIAPDRTLYNALWGTNTMHAVEQAEAEAFYEELGL